MKLNTYLYCTLLAVLLSSCVMEESRRCGSYLYLSYCGDGNKQILPEKMDNIFLYIYNEQKELIQEEKLSREELSRSQWLHIALPDGQYEVVCLGGVNTYTAVKEADKKELAGVYARQQLLGEAVTTIDSLYFGSLSLEIDRSGYSLDTLHLSSAHIKMMINLYDSVYEGEMQESPYRIEMENISEYMSFNHRFSSDIITYHPEPVCPGFIIHTIAGHSFNVLRFDDDNEVRVKLLEASGGSVLYEFSLSEFMQKHFIHVEGVQEAFIGINIYITPFTIQVEPWESENIHPIW